MSDASVNGIKPNEVSAEMVALYLLASVVRAEPSGIVNLVNGVPVIVGKDKAWILTNYADCLKSVSGNQAYIC